MYNQQLEYKFNDYSRSGRWNPATEVRPKQVGENPLNGSSETSYMDEDIVSTLGEIPRKFIGELHSLTNYVKTLDIRSAIGGRLTIVLYYSNIVQELFWIAGKG